MEIRDNLITPYWITKDLANGGYVLMKTTEIVSRAKGTTRIGDKVLSYHTTVGTALEAIAKCLAADRLRNKVVTVREYITELKETFDSIKSLAEI